MVAAVWRVHQRRYRREAQHAQRHVDQAAGAQNALQGGDAQDDAGEKRGGKQEHQQQPVAPAMPGDEIGDGPGEHQADERRQRSALEDRAEEEGAVGRLAEQDAVIVEVPVGIELIALGAPEAEHDDGEQRQEQRHRDEKYARPGEQKEGRDEGARRCCQVSSCLKLMPAFLRPEWQMTRSPT